MPSTPCSIALLLRVCCLVLLLCNSAGRTVWASPADVAPAMRHVVAAESYHAVPPCLRTTEWLHAEALAPVAAEFAGARPDVSALPPWLAPPAGLASEAASGLAELPVPPVQPRLQQARQLLLALAPNAP